MLKSVQVTWLSVQVTCVEGPPVINHAKDLQLKPNVRVGVLLVGQYHLLKYWPYLSNGQWWGGWVPDNIRTKGPTWCCSKPQCICPSDWCALRSPGCQSWPAPLCCKNAKGLPRHLAWLLQGPPSILVGKVFYALFGPLITIWVIVGRCQFAPQHINILALQNAVIHTLSLLAFGGNNGPIPQQFSIGFH